MQNQPACKNIVLITIDSLRADFLQLNGGHIVTPNIDFLAKESMVFQNAYSVGPATRFSFPGNGVSYVLLARRPLWEVENPTADGEGRRYKPSFFPGPDFWPGL